MTALARAWDSDIAYSFRRSPVAVVSAVVLLVIAVGAFFCTWLAPYNPYDLASLSLMDSFQPPAFMPDGTAAHLLGTDDQGRDMLSGIMYGARISLIVGLSMFLLLGRPLAWVTTSLTRSLNGMSGTSVIILGVILGLMMCFDLGGPVNKAAYAFATSGLNVTDPASLA